MYTPSGKAKCKSCGCEIEAGEVRCPRHEREFKRWLARLDGETAERRDVYTPRVDGIKGEFEGRVQQQPRKRSLIPELQPEARLNFK